MLHTTVTVFEGDDRGNRKSLLGLQRVKQIYMRVLAIMSESKLQTRYLCTPKLQYCWLQVLILLLFLEFEVCSEHIIH